MTDTKHLLNNNEFKDINKIAEEKGTSPEVELANLMFKKGWI